MPGISEDRLLKQAAAAMEALGPWPAGSRVALACSGGADSTFLALAWKQFAAGRPLDSLVWVVDHCHRPETAREAQRAAALYADLGLESQILLAPSARPREGDLRTARYLALSHAADESGVQVVVTGHQADDAAETVLLRILRGTGLRGLAGIPARRELSPGVELRRPLLALRREAIRRALRQLGQEWLEDPTNADPKVAARNRLRGELLPALRGVATGDPVEALLRLAQEGADWKESLAGLLDYGGRWEDLPSYLRREAIAREIRPLGATVSPARLRDLEGALLRRRSAAVDERWRLSTAGGRLRLLSRS